MGLSYAIERITDCWDELADLSAAHFAEVSDLAATHALDLDRECYAGLERKGGHLFAVARDGACRLVGYLSLIIRRSPHAKALSAWQDAIYLHPDHRAGWNAAGLISAADAELRERGVAIVYQFVPTAHDFGAVLRQMGYNPTEIVWTRHLTHQAKESSV
jgi:GNAT superfamily N-acetyltransferase